jgi:hypothetical protein
MRRALVAVLLAGALAVSTTKPAEARWGWGWGWGLGAFAVGALIGAALWRPAYSYYYPAYSYPAYGYGYGYPAYGYGYPAYSYGGYGGYYGYRVARRSSAIVLARAKSPIVLARAKKNSEIAVAGAKIRRVHGVASVASSTATSSRTHPPKRVQGRFATGGSTTRNAI